MGKQNIFRKFRQELSNYLRKLRSIDNIFFRNAVDASLMKTKSHFLWSYESRLPFGYLTVFDPSEPD